jgi:hypothetical protein
MRDLFETRRVLVLILALGIFALATRPATDPDLWWHLRTGQLTIQTHHISHTDPYSFTRAGQPWIDHEWLSEVLMYGMYRIAGLGSLIILFAAIVSASFMIVFFRCRGSPYFAALLTIWAAIASVPLFGVRPQMLSLFMGSLFLLLLDSSVARPALVWWTVPLMLLWVNLHAAYALGLVFIFLYLAGEAVEALFHQAGAGTRWVRVKRLAMLMVLATATVPFNPNGVRIFSYPFQTLRSPTMQSFINEWSSPNFHNANYFPLTLMLLTLIITLPVSRGRIKVRELLLVGVATAAALFSVRHIPLFAIIAPPILSLKSKAWFDNTSRRLSSRGGRATANPVWLNSLVLAALVVFVGVRVRFTLANQQKREAESFPAHAIVFLGNNEASQPLLNHYNWGGYMIWKLYPRYRVYIDGRADVYGDSLMRDFASAYYLSDDWQTILQRAEIRTVMLPPDAPLITGLRSHPGWKQVYSDSQATIMVKVSTQ